MDLKYNYVVFNWLYSLSGKEEDYYYICLKDLEGFDNIRLNCTLLPGWPNWLLYLFKIHHSRIINKWIKLPFKSFWYPFIFKNPFKDNKPICFVCVSFPPANYFKFLHKKYPDCKIVILCRDLLKTHADMYEEYMIKKTADIWMSYDKNESEKHGFPHFEEFESKIDIPIGENYPISDVFFAGMAKDRLPKLIEVYDNLSSKGINCLFYIVGVRKKDRTLRDGIIYLDKGMTYNKMLYLSVNSKCILEINQGNAIGYSSRFLEAVMFNKKLITDNNYIKESKYYDPNFIQIIDNINNIDAEWVEDDINVDYHYDGDFSPLQRIKLIDSILP